MSPKSDLISSIECEAVPSKHCHACGETHIAGYCPLKLTSIEQCGLCGIAYCGAFDKCPHLMSEGQVRLMLDALKASTEPKEIIEMARTQLRTQIHKLAEKKKQYRASLGPVSNTSYLQPHETDGPSSNTI